VLTPHGLEYQGNFWSYDFSLTNLPGEYFSARGLEFYGSLNFLKSGILFSDAVVLPSERFAAAAQTSIYGCGLEAVLKESAGKLVGIPDGHEGEGWNPVEDPSLIGKAAFRGKSRAANAEKLAGVMGWETGAAATLSVFCDASPGQEILLEALDRILPHNLRVVLFGDPGRANWQGLEVARRKHRGRFTALREFSEESARLALGGSDFFLLPGPADPSSPWLVRSLRYGCVPIAFQCAGLQQFVTERRGSNGNGFLFSLPTASALADACLKALNIWSSSEAAASLSRACMAADFSSQAAASAHEELYAGLLGDKVSRTKRGG
jgi:starch synthase